MPYQYINELLYLSKVKIVNIEIEIEEDHAIIELISVDRTQDYPYCHSTSANRNGNPYRRDVRHPAAFGKSVNLRVPAICLACAECGCTFKWEYPFEEVNAIVQECLGYDVRLAATYKWKENFITWYDCAPDVKITGNWFERWYNEGKSIGLDVVDGCLKTMSNWKEEIINYHRLRYTNAAV